MAAASFRGIPLVVAVPRLAALLGEEVLCHDEASVIRTKESRPGRPELRRCPVAFRGKRFAGIVDARRAAASSIVIPSRSATGPSSAVARSVAWIPGSRLLMTTPCSATCRAVPATNPVSPVRAAFESPSCGIGAFTDCDVMLTTRPQPRSIIPGRTACIMAIGASMLASSALMKSSRDQSDQTPGGGPPALLTRMSTAPAASSTAARPASVVMSPATAVTETPCASRIAAAVASSASAPRALITRSTPSPASASAQPRPSPFEAAQTIARFPRIPRSIAVLHVVRTCVGQSRCNGKTEAAGH